MFEIFKKERIRMNFGYVFVAGFPSNYANSFTVIASFFSRMKFLQNVKIEKIHMDSEKLINLFEMRKG